MSNRYSVDYEKKTVRQLPDMEKPVFGGKSGYAGWEIGEYGIDNSSYLSYFNSMPTYPCPTMPESWRERETVELDKDFKIRQQWYDTKNKIWVDYFNVEERYVRSLNADTRQIAIPIAEVKNEKPDEGGSILKEALEEIIHTSASKAYTPFQKVNRIFQIAASALQTPQPNK